MSFRVLRPLPGGAARPLSVLVLVAWSVTMAMLVHRAQAQSTGANLAADLARYGSTAHWRGVYYRGEKVGFTVSQTVPRDEGFELQEDGRLQMALLGATTAAVIRTTAVVGRDFSLRSFEFSLDPGTGATRVRGEVAGRTLNLTIATPGGERSEMLDFDEPPLLAATLPRRLAAAGLVEGRFNADNPTQVAGSYGGVMFMVMAVLYVIVTIALLGWGTSIYLLHRSQNVPLPADRIAVVAGCLAAAAALSVAVWWWGMRSGLNVIEKE